MVDRSKPKDLGQQIVDAWNAGRLDEVMEAYADQIRMSSFAPDHSGSQEDAKVYTKPEVQKLLSRAIQERPFFELVSSFESETSISLVLRDSDGKLFTVAFMLDANGKITSVTSLRTQS